MIHISRRPSGLRKTTITLNSLAHRTTWLRSDLHQEEAKAISYIRTHMPDMDNSKGNKVDNKVDNRGNIHSFDDKVNDKVNDTYFDAGDNYNALGDCIACQMGFQVQK